MKISKSLKIYTHIILAFFLINSLQANTKLLNNVVIHDKPIKINQLRFKDVNLQDVDLTGKKGNIMILNFWASWCQECQTEAVILEKFFKKYGVNNKELVMIGIAIQDTPEKAKAFAKHFGKTYLLGLDDKAGNIALNYGIYGVPETFSIDSGGKVFHKNIGMVTTELMEQKLKPFLQ